MDVPSRERKGEDQQFWNSLLRDALGVADVESHIPYQVPVVVASHGDAASSRVAGAGNKQTDLLASNDAREMGGAVSMKPPLDAGNLYIIGNPPFVGYSLQTPEQRADILALYRDEKSKPYKTAGKVDYVAGWYWKAAELMDNVANVKMLPM